MSRFLLAAAALLAGAGTAAWAAEPSRGQRIVEIRYETRNVFEGEPEEKNALFSMADAVHRRTRRRVVERELLFAVGDPYDPALIQETERNLRGLPFLRRVEVVGIETSSGAVVIVRTWDAWTLELLLRYSRAGGVTNTAAGASDHNVLGNGKSAALQYEKSGGSVQRSASYQDPQLLGKPHLVYQLSAADSTNMRSYSTSLGRPFYASITKSSLVGGGTYTEDRQTIYEDLTQAGTVGRQHYDAFLTYGYALEATPRRTRRVTATLTQSRDAYTGLSDVGAAFVPDARQQTALVAGYQDQEVDFIKQKHIQKLSHEEDFNTGLSFLPTLGYAPYWRALGATGEQITPKVDMRKGFVSELGQFVFLRGDYSSVYVNGRDGDRVATLQALYFCRYFPRHTVAANFQVDRGWRLDGGALLGLGEDNGLRGYHAKQFQGDRRVLFNLEDRVFFVDDLFRLLDAGGVVFFDSGRAWMPSEPARFAQLSSSYGFGLRLGATRSADNEPVRIDIAHALNDNQSRSRWTVSVAAGAAFGPN